MSTMKIKSGYVMLINGQKYNIKESLLPSDDHPFDHYAVVTTLEIPS